MKLARPLRRDRLTPSASQLAESKWTNRSVQRFAQGGNPASEIQKRAREITLQAIDSGWSGPPFDPLALADLLGIRVKPSQFVQDARLLPNEDLPLIEYNPTKSRARVHYSIAHEIAHTLFPDYKEEVRHRQKTTALARDAWELEVLCNIAAAEFLMPVGTLVNVLERSVSIDTLMELRKEYAVSAEAILLRYVHGTRLPCAVFACSRVEGDGELFNVDYFVPSASWRGEALHKGNTFPDGGSLAGCRSVGYTAKGSIRLRGNANLLKYEAVAIAPYPGTNNPRVLGLLKSPPSQEESPSIVYLKGDVLDPRGTGNKVIAHVVNDKAASWGGGGIARQLKRRFPAAAEDYKKFYLVNKPLFKLGNIRLSEAEEGLWIASLIAQHGYGSQETRRLRYYALDKCLLQLSEAAKLHDASVHMPLIGAGQAGGDWQVIEQLIRFSLICAGVNTFVYELPR